MKAVVRIAMPAALASASLVATAASADPHRASHDERVHTADLCPHENGAQRCDAQIVTDANGVAIHSFAGPVGGYAPADLQSAYGLPATGGNGRIVAVWAGDSDNPTAESDLAVYRAQFNLPPCTSQNGCFRKIDENGGTSYSPPGTDEGEQALDIDMVSAGCPGCRILVVEGKDMKVALATVIAEGAMAFSFSVEGSYGEADNAADCQSWGFDDTHGLLVTSAAGDTGYPGTAHWLPTLCQGVVAVGGTKLEKDSSPRGWSEIVWGGSGSGCNTAVAKPAWQTDPGCTGRMANDISAEASPYPGVAFYFTTGGQGWGTVGGTSVAAPLTAAALTSLGIANGHFSPAWVWQNAARFYDITSGSTNNCGDAGVAAYYCNGEPGYDGPTGWGSPNGASLAGAVPPSDLDGGSSDGGSWVDAAAGDAAAQVGDAGADHGPGAGPDAASNGDGAPNGGGCAAAGGAASMYYAPVLLVIVGAALGRRRGLRVSHARSHGNDGK